MKRLLICLTIAIVALPAIAADYRREITVAQDSTGDFATLTEALEAVRAYMDYTVTINIRNGVYHEKVIVPSWLQHVDIVGESADSVIITHGDYAGLNNMGTFRTYTLRVDGNHINISNLTIENSAGEVGQAVALHTEGDSLTFTRCRFLGNQDTVFTGGLGKRLTFDNCYIEGTTDFIFGGSTALFRDCRLHSKRNSYITAASTPQYVPVGYVFYRCCLTAAPGVDKVYLGRPWRPYAFTAFIDCEMGSHIAPSGWDNWRDPANERTARYSEYGSSGPGAAIARRVPWATPLTPAARQLFDE